MSQRSFMNYMISNQRSAIYHRVRTITYKYAPAAIISCIVNNGGLADRGAPFIISNSAATELGAAVSNDDMAQARATLKAENATAKIFTKRWIAVRISR